MRNQEIINKFIEHKQNHNRSSREDGISHNTILLYQRNLRYLDETIKKPFKEVTEKDLDKFLKGHTKRTQNLRIIIFKEFYKWLYKKEYHQPLPEWIDELRQYRIRIDNMKHAERVITPVEYNTLLEHCYKPMHKAVIEAVWITGGRRNEIQTIKGNGVTYDGKVTRIIIWISKTETREVIYPDRAEHLLKWAETLSPNAGKNDYLFVTKNNKTGAYEPINYNYTWGLINDICKRARIRHLKPHDFRHTRTTTLLREGVQNTHVATLLGWTKNSPMIGYYDHNTIKDYEEWLNRKNIATKPTFEYMENQQSKKIQDLEKKVQELLILFKVSRFKKSQRDTEAHRKIQELQGMKA